MSRDEGILYAEIGSERYAFRSRDVRHLERAEHLRPDAAADGRVGVLMLGGLSVPVFPLGGVLERPFTQSIRSDGHIAVTGVRQQLVGWMVDRVARAEHGQLEIAPLPALIGERATTWFEGIVRINDDSSALLLAPQSLNPLAPVPPSRRETTGAVAGALNRSPEPVAVVFSSAALPASPARRYAISGRQITAIVQPSVPLPVPGSADHVLGVTWWRRSVVPVIDFRDRADHGWAADRRRLIARCGARHGGALVAFSIDADVLMCRPDGAHRRVADLACPWFATGIFDINGEAVALVDLDVLLQSRFGNGDAVLADFLVERAAGHTEALGGPLDAPAFGV